MLVSRNGRCGRVMDGCGTFVVALNLRHRYLSHFAKGTGDTLTLRFETSEQGGSQPQMFCIEIVCGRGRGSRTAVDPDGIGVFLLLAVYLCIRVVEEVAAQLHIRIEPRHLSLVWVTGLSQRVSH